MIENNVENDALKLDSACLKLTISRYYNTFESLGNNKTTKGITGRVSRSRLIM